MKALILVDIQNDFTPNEPAGALVVPDGDAVVPVANRLMLDYELVVATQDFHPADHGSFASQHDGGNVGEMIELNGLPQVLWPDHCVEGTDGAALIDALDTDRIERVFPKGRDRTVDSYSGFFDNGPPETRAATGMSEYLKNRGVDEIDIVGLATDYCVKFTAIDAAELGFKTRVLLEGCRGVELNEGDCAKAVEEMKNAGVEVIES